MRGALAERRVHQYMRIACRAAELQEIETHDIPAPRAKGGVLGDVDLTAVDHRRSAVIAIGFPRVLGGEGAVSGGWFQHSNEIPVLEFGPGAMSQLRRGRKKLVVHWPFSSHRRYRWRKAYSRGGDGAEGGGGDSARGGVCRSGAGTRSGDGGCALCRAASACHLALAALRLGIDPILFVSRCRSCPGDARGTRQGVATWRRVHEGRSPDRTALSHHHLLWITGLPLTVGVLQPEVRSGGPVQIWNGW